MDIEQIQKAGANARALGRDRYSNPYYKVEHMPVNTGQTYEKWQADIDAWDLGWQMEDALKG
jgi:hypothetical protein